MAAWRQDTDDEIQAELGMLRASRSAFVSRLRSVVHEGHRLKLTRQVEACDRHIERIERMPSAARRG